MVRAAVLLSGHLREACDEGWWALVEQVGRCRDSFPRGCDVFLHTWHTTRPLLHTPSLPCVSSLVRALAPAAVSVERQETSGFNMSRPWRASVRSYEAYRFNIAGMIGAASLMRLHAAQRHIHYSVALRLRTDIGSPRIVRLVNGTLSLDAWRTLHRAASAPPSARELRSCSAIKRPGAAGEDNCFWSAPTEPLVDTLHALRDNFDALSQTPIRKGCLHDAHPESLLRCAAKLAGVVGKPLVGG
ncbi:MAG: hypothetical protein SGPRY_011462 [Prymnesium sp.]